ncbi:MAG TPA: hypothetical protein VF669_19110 [Tepidisphaeraceae bacterium]|jgi:hypothetical protein
MLCIPRLAAPVLGLGLALGVVGCADRHHDVPEDAVTLRDAKGGLTAHANHTGNVYVYDESAKKMIYSGQVNDGDSISVEPTADRIVVNGKTVSQQELDNNHRFRVFLDEKEMRDRGITYGRDAIGTSGRGNTGDGRTTVIERQGDSTVIRQPDSNTTVITRPNNNTGDTTIIRERP